MTAISGFNCTDSKVGEKESVIKTSSAKSQITGSRAGGGGHFVRSTGVEHADGKPRSGAGDGRVQAQVP